MCFRKMEQEKSSSIHPAILVVDYVNVPKDNVTVVGSKQGYAVENCGIATLAGKDFMDLFTVLLHECRFGSSLEHGLPKYNLFITNPGKNALNKTEVNLLEAVVNYHNHIVEKGKQNQGG